MANRRQSKVADGAQRVVAKIWEIRRVLVLVFAYLFLFVWLFAEGRDADIRPSEILAIPNDPLWERPDSEHWFGTTGDGTDLFELTRIAMATTVAISVVISGLGVGLTFLYVMMFSFDPGERRFTLLKRIGRVIRLLPAFLAPVILAGGAGGGMLVTGLTLIVLIAFHLAPTVAKWFEEGEGGRGIQAGYVLGLTRSGIVTNRVVPVVLRRLIGVFACLIPIITLVEMSLSFLGFAGDRLSCGDLVAHGQDVIIEAPWMAVAPGILATAVVVILSLLGWFSSTALKTGRLPRWI